MVKYVIDEGKRRVVALVDGCEMDTLRRVNKIASKRNFSGVCPIGIPDFMLMNKTYVGVAKCNEADTWDVETGKAIALRKCLTKYNRDERKHLEQLIAELNEALAVHQIALEQVGKRKYQ